MKCLRCKKEFISKRSTAKFCSDKCRVYAKRGKDAPGSTEWVVKTVNKIVAEKVDKPCKHGFPPAFCRFARPGKPCK